MTSLRSLTFVFFFVLLVVNCALLQPSFSTGNYTRTYSLEKTDGSNEGSFKDLFDEATIYNNSLNSAETNTDWWPMFRHDLRHTAYSTSKVQNNNQTLWNYTTGSSIGFSSPAVADGKVYIGSWDGKVYALNAFNGSLIWNYTTGNIVESSPAVADGRVFIGSWDNKIYALNASSGALLWNYTTGNPIGYSSPAVADGKVFIGSYDNKVYALNASTGAKIWNYTTIDNVDSSPAVADGKVFIGSYDGKVYALNASNGFLIWNYTTGDAVYSSPVVADGKVFIGSYDNKVYALNASSGSHIWNYTTADDVDSSPAFFDGRVYVGSRDNKVYALNASSGALLWSYTTGSGVFSSAVVADGKVFIGSYDGKVYALNASSGALLWSYATGSWVYSSPAVADGKVYIGSWDRKVYAFGSHDIAISSVATSIAQAYEGQIVDINVTAKNEGTETETFNVTAYFNITAIETKTVTNLAPSSETTLIFNWNTTNVTPGNYTIKAVASTVRGEIDTADNTYIDGSVKVIKSPVAHFTYSPTSPLTGETITFDASLSTPDGGTIISYEWNFGDGTPNATGMITTHTYTDNGTYAVTLTVTDDDGLADTCSQNITVLNRPPIASFTESATTVPTDTVITFNASYSYDLDGYIVSYFWDFGDSANGTSVTTEHAYADNGTYIVTLTITDDDGATAVATATKIISNRVPTASFTENATTVYTGEIIHFNASESFDPDGYIASYFWDFGDGTNATGVIIVHSYADNGTYIVTLTVTDDDGATASTSAIKTVLNRAPVASFTESATTVLTNESIDFDASRSYDSDGTIVSFFWDFGDNTNATGVSVSHAYTNNGVYTVTLTVTDDDNATASAQATKTILNRLPVANFTESAETVYDGETIIFNASASYDLDGMIVNYFWDFGDGTNTTGVRVSHAYSDDGIYIVTLTVTDDDSAVATATAAKTILNRAPVASFTESAETVFLGETIMFDASGSYDPDGAIVTYFWDFGDDTNATGVTVNHTYLYDGTYTLTLTVTDDDNVSTSTSAIKTVRTRPDIAVTNVTVSKNVVGQGRSVQINVTIINEGDYTETFNVTVYANTTAIKTKEITLASKNHTTIIFTWNTTSFSKGNYTIKAIADSLLGEIDIEDNTSTDGWVIIALVGDVNADGIVDIADIYLITLAYGTTPGQPRYNPNYDVNDDNIIDIADIYIAALHYGEN